MESSNKAEAYRWAKDILATKEKVPTTAAKDIKDEMSHLIENELSNFKNELPMETDQLNLLSGANAMISNRDRIMK